MNGYVEPSANFMQLPGFWTSPPTPWSRAYLFFGSAGRYSLGKPLLSAAIRPHFAKVCCGNNAISLSVITLHVFVPQGSDWNQWKVPLDCTGFGSQFLLLNSSSVFNSVFNLVSFCCCILHVFSHFFVLLFLFLTLSTTVKLFMQWAKCRLNKCFQCWVEMCWQHRMRPRGAMEKWRHFGSKKLGKEFSSDWRAHHGFLAAILSALMNSLVHYYYAEIIVTGDIFMTCLTKLEGRWNWVLPSLYQRKLRALLFRPVYLCSSWLTAL